jgi:ABC-type nitrate/sulfonate/bicarbonate transport system permease component
VAATDVVTGTAARWRPDAVLVIRVVIIALLLVGWQALALSGLLYKDVVPPLQAIAGALVSLLTGAAFYANLWATGYELVVAVAVGASLGLVVGIVLGGSRFMAQAFEQYFYYLAPTPKIIFFPILIMWFGVGPGSKMAMGALSCFFPVALSTAAGMRSIAPILIKVGRSFRLNQWQMVTRIYLPAMRGPVVDGLRLGVGIAIIGVLLAETKLSNQGLGFMVIRNYQRFDMPAMYALIITVFGLAILINSVLTHVSGAARLHRS